MKTNRSAWHLWSGCVVSTMIGCVPIGTGTTSSTDGVIPTAVFPDDDDPATAALPVVEGELLVQPFPGADAETLDNLYAQVGAVVTDRVDDIDLTVLEVPEDEVDAIAAWLAESHLIESIHRTYILQAQEAPDDPLFDRQPHLDQVNVPDAWEETVGSDDILIAIVDTGVEPDHEDLSDRIVNGWNIYDNDPDFDDVKGHGTQVAGVAAAATDNNTGVAGVTWDCPVIAVRVTNDAGLATSRQIAAGILWAAGQGAKVINVSFAPLWSNEIVKSAARQAYNRGALVVISAGNEGGTAGASGYDEALFVGAVEATGRIASFSDRGPFVDLVAPGTDVRTTAVGSGYRLSSGTSFAAPIVTGVAALAWSVNPDLRPATIVEALTTSAADLGARGKDSTYGHGLVDAEAAVEAALEASYTPDTTPPSLSIARPRDGASFSGRYTVSVSASDRWGVADVVMYVDDIPFATDTRTPYRFVIDTSDFSRGEHELGFIATDLAGNASRIETVGVSFGTSGGSTAGVVFESPRAGARVSGNVTIDATVAANVGLATVEWFVDGESVFVTTVTGTSSQVSYLWRTSGVQSGSHTISLVVIDAAGGQNVGYLELVKR